MTTDRTLLVLGGGGALGAYQAGALLALAEAGIVPDALFGCSAGALNAAFLARDPGVMQARLLVDWWSDTRTHGVLAPSPLRRVLGLAAAAAAGGQALFDERPLRRLIARVVPAHDIAELAVPLVVTTTCLDCGRAVHHAQGAPGDVLVASCALPGIFPATRLVDGHRHVDGGVVCGVPIGAALAVARPGDRVFVLDCALAPVTGRPGDCAALPDVVGDLPDVLGGGCRLPAASAVSGGSGVSGAAGAGEPRRYRAPVESHRGVVQTVLDAFAVARAEASRAAVEPALDDPRVRVLPHVADAWAAGLLDRLPAGPRDLSVTRQLLTAGHAATGAWLAGGAVRSVVGGAARLDGGRSRPAAG